MALSDNVRGVLYMNASMLAFTVNDTFIQSVTKTMPLFQAIAVRGMLTTVALLMIARLMHGSITLWPNPSARRILALRTFAEIASTALFLLALMHMPLANLSAIMQCLPLAVTLFAAVFLGERVGGRRLLAVLIGFVGVMLIIQPGADSFNRWSLMGLASVAFIVLRDLSTRKFSADILSVTVALWASIGVTAMGFVVTAFQGWPPMTLTQFALVFAASIALIAGYMFAVMVMRVGDVSFVAPFRYTSLLWAIVFGLVLYGTFPDSWTLIGSAIVVVTGIYSLWTERSR